MENDNLIVDLGYAVWHGELTLEEALAYVVQNQVLGELDEGNLWHTDAVIEAVMGEWLDLAYVLALLNDAVARRFADDRLCGQCALRLGTLSWHMNRLDQAARLLREAIGLFQELGDREAACMAMGNLGGVLFAQNRLDQAAEAYRQTLALSAGNRIMEGIAHLSLGNTLRALGRLEEAVSHYQQALDAFSSVHEAELERTCWEKLRDTLIDQIGRYRQEGKTDRLIATLQQGIQLSQQVVDPRMETVLRLDLAETYLEQEQPQAATRSLLDGLSSAKDTADPLLHGHCLLYLSLAYRMQGQMEPARTSLDSALALALEAGDQDLEGRTRGELGRLLHEIGDAALAIEQLRLSLALSQKMGNRQGEGMARYHLAMAHRDLGQWEAAIEAAVEGLDDFHENHPLWAELRGLLGELYYQRTSGNRADNLDQVITYYRAAVSKWTPEVNPQMWIRAHIALGSTLRERLRGDRAENIEQAIFILEQALARVDPETSPDEWGTIQNSLGNCYYDRLRGDRGENLERALAHLHKALLVRTRQAKPSEWATTQNNLGNVYRQRVQGHLIENLERAIEALEAAGTVHTREAEPAQWSRIQHNLGAVYLDLAYEDVAENDERIERAIACFGEALTERQPDEYLREWSATQNSLGSAYLMRQRGSRADNLDRAIAALEQSSAAARHLELDADLADAQAKLATAWLDQESWSAAHRALDQAIAALERLEGQQSTEAARRAHLRQIASLCADDALCLAMLGKAPEALQQLERGRTRFLIETMSREDVRLETLTPQDRETFTALRERLRGLEAEQRAPTARPWMELAAALREARQQFAALVQHIRQQAPGFLPAMLSTEQIASLVDAGTALVTWAVTQQGTVTFIVSEAGGVETIVDRDFASGDLLDLLIEGLDEDRRPVGGWMGGYDRYHVVEATEARSPDRERQLWFASLAQLWEPLLAPVDRRLQALSIRRLILVPYGGLRMLPLHAVGRPCFLDKYTVSYAPSLAVLARCRQRAGEPERLAAVGTLLVCHSGGNLHFALAETRRLSDLLYNAGESAQVLSEAEAVSAEVESLATGCRQLHFACHGKYNWNRPTESGLWLAGSDGALKPYALWEIQAGLDLHSARLVILSACETGLSETFDLPEEFVGLPAGFLIAGAPGVISSLWTVSDFSTMLLMERLYVALLNGASPPSALREAQLWLRQVSAGELAAYFEAERKKRNETRATSYQQASTAWRRFAAMEPDDCPFEHPYYWAAFTFSGA
jgi:CHAT domain-containing protein